MDRLRQQLNTHAAMDNKFASIGDLPLYSKKTKSDWLRSIKKDGVEALLYIGVDDMVGDKTEPAECGMHEQYWVESGAEREPVVAHLTALPYAGIYSAKRYLPVYSRLSSIMCAVSSALTEDKDMVVTSPQLFVAAPGGFSPNYFRDDEHSEDSYRCFMFLGGYIVRGGTEDTEGQEDLVRRRGYAHIVCNPHAVEELEKPVISMRAVYEEARNKFRMFPGDILVCKTSAAFCVELPISARMEDARMLSWVVKHKLPEQKFPVPVSKISVVPIVEDVIEEDIENIQAQVFYEEEAEDISTSEIQVLPEEGVDVSGLMERKRVTPSVYENHELVTDVCYKVTGHYFMDTGENRVAGPSGMGRSRVRGKTGSQAGLSRGKKDGSAKTGNVVSKSGRGQKRNAENAMRTVGENLPRKVTRTKKAAASNRRLPQKRGGATNSRGTRTKIGGIKTPSNVRRKNRDDELVAEGDVDSRMNTQRGRIGHRATMDSDQDDAGMGSQVPRHSILKWTTVSRRSKKVKEAEDVIDGGGPMPRQESPDMDISSDSAGEESDSRNDSGDSSMEISAAEDDDSRNETGEGSMESDGSYNPAENESEEEDEDCDEDED